MSQQSTQELFRHTFGAWPDAVWSAPGRVNLIGEHTDYNDGWVLPFALQHRSRAAVRALGEPVLRVASTSLEGVAECPVGDVAAGWAAYPTAVAAVLAREGAHRRGAEILIDSEVPLGAGLSSSAALELAVGAALNDVWQLGLPLRRLAGAGQVAENDLVGAPTGIMDQFASAFGERDAAVLLDCRNLEHEVVPLGLDDAGLALLVMDSRQQHALVDGGYADRRRECRDAARVLGVESLRDVTTDTLPAALDRLDDVGRRRVRHVVTENHRVLECHRILTGQGPGAVGALLTASHHSLRDDFEVSTPAIDTAVEAALEAGALGARLTGGGFGGSALALIEATMVEEVTHHVRQRVTAAGHPDPHLFRAVPSDGVRRDPERTSP